MNIMGYELVQTCGACPEQYDVYDENNNQVGYLRLRHGYFRADIPVCGGETIYEAYPKGDGCFDCDERDYYLEQAIKSISKATFSDELTYYREKYNNEYALR